jgi:16S rRNA (guanine(966)-N(2))-methyltransferase RsmD
LNAKSAFKICVINLEQEINMPRVIAGKCGGIPLSAPKGEKTRPTTDKVKESLFSILQMRLVDAAFLDLFAGSGQMGIEAVSRGARRAVLVDENSACALAVSANTAKTKLQQQICFVKKDVFRALRDMGTENEKYDIIFMDPPYASALDYMKRAAAEICSYRLLISGGLFIVEHSSLDLMPENVINMTLYRRCKYGSTMLTFYTTDACYSGGIPDT